MLSEPVHRYLEGFRIWKESGWTDNSLVVPAWDGLSPVERVIGRREILKITGTEDTQKVLYLRVIAPDEENL